MVFTAAEYQGERIVEVQAEMWDDGRGPRSVRGRGVSANPPNRFERLYLESESYEGGALNPKTVFFRDSSRSIIATNDSPDVPFDASVNPYRGCEVGCAYCYARPTHEYFGLSAGLDFESKIFVKEDAPNLLRRELARSAWRPKQISMSGVTDPYQPIERKLSLTRRCLQVFAEFRNPVCVVTKNHLVTRDIDVLAELARYNAAAVYLTMTTLDGGLARKLEPRASQPELRLDAIRALSSAGIPTGVLASPVIPGLTDHELPAILSEARRHGAAFAGYMIVRLPLSVGELFDRWLEANYPTRRDKVLNRIRSMREGRLNAPEFGKRMRGTGPFAEQVDMLFRLGCRKAEIGTGGPLLSTEHFRRPRQDGQMDLFATSGDP